MENKLMNIKVDKLFIAWLQFNVELSKIRMLIMKLMQDFKILETLHINMFV